MTIVFFRTVLLYLTVLIVIRIMGKAELSKMSPFQLIIIFMIAELASIPIESPDVSIITGITAIFTLMFLQVLISFISLKSEGFKKFFSGKPSILIDKGMINHRELKRLRITINDLMEQLRLGNTPSISDVEYAVMESNGDLSIILKAPNNPVTPNDLSLIKPREIMPCVFISDGVLYTQNIIRTRWTEEKLLHELMDMGFPRPEDVFLAFCDGKSQLHVFTVDEGDEYAGEIGFSGKVFP